MTAADSIYHVENEAEVKRVSERIKKSCMWLPNPATKATRWLATVVAFPRMHGDAVEFADGSPLVNCYAHALGLAEWFEPLSPSWPEDVPPTRLPEHFEMAFERHGFRRTTNLSPRPGTELAALYVEPGGFVCHAARGLPDGRWESKIGRNHVVSGHSLHAFSRSIYGEFAFAMRRRLPRFGLTRRPRPE